MTYVHIIFLDTADVDRLAFCGTLMQRRRMSFGGAAPSCLAAMAGLAAQRDAFIGSSFLRPVAFLGFHRETFLAFP